MQPWSTVESALTGKRLCALNLWDYDWEIEDICFALMILRSSLYRC